MSVSIDEVRHVAALARLGLDESRLESLAASLSSILQHIEVLATADTSGVADDEVSARGAMQLRLDGGAPLPMLRALEDFAPQMREGFLIVPRLATHEEEAGA
jgi:aspartyl-tRNA(Asn)/glutamyl-tRNA(Gln) amidotransferase subunit C